MVALWRLSLVLAIALALLVVVAPASTVQADSTVKVVGRVFSLGFIPPGVGSVTLKAIGYEQTVMTGNAGGFEVFNVPINRSAQL